ncbi:DUF6152 family protein [Acidovorax sp. sic0104]|uniref:DUF6152 family protein n=1 Tax=Acidovorax sp. sic0104 TaxID=2854784 RepID=UPI001C44723F|nr:DUF6152 family protein [Acidovorax sp. sic0104]MBV7544532.1 hypothetical protein [Acidovorax sp. sic0104]
MSLHRRHLLVAAATMPLGAHAHHGWSSFDADRPIYLEGTVRSVRWQNPHAELQLDVPAGLALPTDLAQRAVPAQTAPVDGKALLAKAVLPRRKDRQWEIELAPLTRMQAWQVQEIKPGTALSVVGFTLRDEKGDAVLRAEYLFVDGKAYGLRSGPA